MLVVAVTMFGAGVSLLLWHGLRSLFERDELQVENYRGRTVATATGLILIASAIFGELVLAAATRWGLDISAPAQDAHQGVAVAVVGFGLLGLLDDFLGDSLTSGYRGHLTALTRGDVTSGAVKILGGGVVALAATVIATEQGVVMLLADAALVALAANLANLFDRRPGRVLKVSTLAFVVIAAAALLNPVLAGTALVVGAGAGLLGADLREELMLGDTGSNPLGAALALGVVVTGTVPVRLGVLVLVVALNLVSERVSFSAVIERNPFLRRADMIGRESPGQEPL